jgi:phage terminase small subunit
MGKRGRQPQPIELKKLRGNLGKRAIKVVPISNTSIPKCPEDLKDIESTWNHYGSILEKLGILRETDATMWEILWRAWKRYKEVKNLELEPERIIKIELELGNSLMRYLSHFGMSPSTRNSLQVEPPREKDEFTEFLERKSVAK